jgi:hypothetical protein
MCCLGRRWGGATHRRSRRASLFYRGMVDSSTYYDTLCLSSLSLFLVYDTISTYILYIGVSTFFGILLSEERREEL